MIAIMLFKKPKFNRCIQTRTERAKRAHIHISIIPQPAHTHILPILSHSFYYCKHYSRYFHQTINYNISQTTSTYFLIIYPISFFQIFYIPFSSSSYKNLTEKTYVKPFLFFTFSITNHLPFKISLYQMALAIILLILQNTVTTRH